MKEFGYPGFPMMGRN